MRFVLASKSPGRLRLLRQVGLDPEVFVSGFDESQVQDPDATNLARRLADAKGVSVTAQIEGEAIVVAGDSVLEFEGRARGKPGTVAAAQAEWRRMRGREGVLHTGHFVWVRDAAGTRSMSRVNSTVVRFADLTEAEIDAYAATGEPLEVAGGFTLDGLGGAFITHLDGDAHNVTGISTSLLRQMLLDLGVQWHTLWVGQERSS
ncbi:MAG: Maf family protein [Arachnia sp.]